MDIYMIQNIVSYLDLDTKLIMRRINKYTNTIKFDTLLLNEYNGSQQYEEIAMYCGEDGCIRLLNVIADKTSRITYCAILGACTKYNYDMVRILIDKDADKLSVDEMNWSLSNVCINGYNDLAIKLLDVGADVNSALGGACSFGDMSFVQLLIDRGATKWNNGLYCACIGGHIGIAKLMISCGATNFNGGLVNACQNGNIQIIDILVEKELNSSPVDKRLLNLNNALTIAIRTQNLTAIKYLIDRGATNFEFVSHYLCESYCNDIYKFLISIGITKCNRCMKMFVEHIK